MRLGSESEQPLIGERPVAMTMSRVATRGQLAGTDFGSNELINDGDGGLVDDGLGGWQVWRRWGQWAGRAELRDKSVANWLADASR
jgi:hypothetical protein